ncbi:unnamed protein product [Withania somnifera]
MEPADEGSCVGLKLVPWISWDEWNSIRHSLFSSFPPSVAFALQRISTWRSRGCVPVSVDVTASIVHIQHKDPFFRKDLGGNALESEEMLSMLYCMAIMRLVNGVVEKTRKKAEISIADAANAIGIPRMLIDVRHEGSHRDLPSLQLVRLASTKALDWLKSYYWEPQKNAIRRDSTASLRKEIKRKLLEMAFCLKVKQTNSSPSPEKRIRLGQLFLETNLCKSPSGNANESLLIGQLSYLCEKIVANLKTLKPLNHNDLAADGEDSSRKLSLPEATLHELLRKCLILSSCDNNQLMSSALIIAQMIGRNSFIQKLNKLCSLSVFDSEIIHSDPSTNNSESFLLSREEDSLRLAGQELELIMHRVVKGGNMNSTDTGSRWAVAKTWKACPIGMLPHAFGSTGSLPVLDLVDDSAEVAKSPDSEISKTSKCGCKHKASSVIECVDDPNMKKMKTTEEPSDNQCTENMDIENGHSDVPLECPKGHLMINGVWKKVSEEELRDIAATVKSLI